jgi:hypothetical protein
MLLAVEDLVTTEPVGEFTLEASGVQWPPATCSRPDRRKI